MRDAVALRVAALSPAARAVVEFAAVVPGSVELSLLRRGRERDRRVHRRGAAEPARRVARASATISRAAPSRTGSRRCASASSTGSCCGRSRRPGTPTRRGSCTTRGAPATPARSSATLPSRRGPPARGRGHRQALEHWEAALAAAGGDDPEALEGVALEAYLCGRAERAVEARQALLAIHEAAGDALRAGDDLRWLSRVLWWMGKGTEAAEAGERAIAILEAFPDSRELALALSGQSQLAMLSERGEEAIALGTRAVRARPPARRRARSSPTA